MRLNIKEQLAKKGISRYKLAQLVGVTYKTMTSIYNGESNSIRLDVLESICRELDCTPNDIIVSEDKQVQRLLAYYRIDCK